MSRYAQQMNAFSVSLTIKSLVALVVLLLYFGTHLPEEIMRMAAVPQYLPQYLQAEEPH
ncbi:Bacterial export protein, family 1 [compost metagenome]